MIEAANDVTLHRITANCRSQHFNFDYTWDCKNDSCGVTQKKAARGRERVGRGFWAWVAGCDVSGFQTATYYFGEGFVTLPRCHTGRACIALARSRK